MIQRKRHKTPEHLDAFFRRGVIDEEDYADFWEEYWRDEDEDRRVALMDTYIRIAAEGQEGLPISGQVLKTKSDVVLQAQQLAEVTGNTYRVVRRDKRGRFSKRGRRYQAVRQVERKRK